MRIDDPTPAHPTDDSDRAESTPPVLEASEFKIKSGLRAGARDGRIYEADELPDEGV